MRSDHQRRLSILLGACAFLAIFRSATAATIFYEAQSLGGDSWQYTYSVTNDSLGVPLEEFTIYFDRTVYSNLAVTAIPSGWNGIVIQPDLELPADGFFDALADGSGIAPGATVSEFSVSFDFIRPGEPAEQSFDVVDPDTFEVLESGNTTTVPAPPAGVALITAALAVVGRLRRRGVART